jgi:LCP family protein required for cell wall assembly
MKKKGLIIGGIGIIVATVLGIGTAQVLAFYKDPINKPLQLVIVKPDQKEVDTPVEEEIVDEEPVAAVTPEPEAVCGNTGSMLVLLTGADFSPGVEPFGADAIRVMLLDFDEPSADLLDIPRDLVVKVGGGAPQNQGEQPIGLAYHYEKQAFEGTETEKVEAATNFLAQTIYDNFGLVSENYFTIQLNNFPDMVDAIGGVEITLPNEITTSFDTTYPAGTQVLNGALAAEFLRTDKPGGLKAREERQNLFLDALKEKVVSFQIIDDVPALIREFEKAITTDLSPELMAQMTCLVDKIGENDIQYHSFPEQATSFESGQLVVSDDEALQEFLKEIFDLE